MTDLPTLVTTTSETKTTTSSSSSSSSSTTTHTTTTHTTSSSVGTTLSTSYTTSLPSIASDTLSSSSYSVTYQATVPSTSLNNPYLSKERYHQGTFYVIVLPIIAALLLVYLFGILWLRIKASRLTKSLSSKSNTQKVPLINGNNNGGGIDNTRDMEKENYFDTYSIPDEENGFFTLQRDINILNAIGGDVSMTELSRSQSRNSFDLLNSYSTNSMVVPKPHDITRQYDNNNNNNNNNNSNSGGGHVSPYHHRSGSILELDRYLIMKPVGFNSTDLMEPEKTARSSTRSTVATTGNNSNNTTAGMMKKGHRKTRSGLVLDEFISTGELPTFDEIQGTNNSMYQDDVQSYRVSRSSSPTRPISPNKARFPSPERR